MMRFIWAIIFSCLCCNAYADFNSGDTFGKGIVVQVSGVTVTGGGRTLNFASGTSVAVVNNAFQITATATGGGGGGSTTPGGLNTQLQYNNSNTFGGITNVTTDGTNLTKLGMAEASNLLFGTITGSQIGTAPTQKLAFYGSTPVVRPNGNICTAMTSIGLVSFCTESGSGTVSPGNIYDVAYYTNTGNLISGSTLFTINSGSMNIADGSNIVLGTLSGTKIGTNANQLLGFFNATPIIQPNGDALTALSNLGLISTPTLTASDVGLSQVTNNAQVTSVTATSPLQSTGGTTPVISDKNTTGSGIVTVLQSSPTVSTPTVTTTLTLADGANLFVGSSTGTSIATVTSQKIAFWGSQPTVRPSGNICVAMQNIGLVSSCTEAGGAATVTIGGAVSGGTASQILATDGSTNLQNLAVATYPSLVELAYVKGVTSAIQTQINGKRGIYDAAQYDNGTCTTSATIDPANGQDQKITLTHADACALTFTQPSSGTTTIRLKIIQSSVSTYNGTISGCGNWGGKTVMTPTATSGAVDWISIEFDGSTTWCTPVNQNFG